MLIDEINPLTYLRNEDNHAEYLAVFVSCYLLNSMQSLPHMQAANQKRCLPARFK
jgi:hypothetical protein